MRTLRTSRVFGVAAITLSTLPVLLALVPSAPVWAQDATPAGAPAQAAPAQAAPAQAAPAAAPESAFIRGMKVFANPVPPQTIYDAIPLLTQAVAEEPKNGDALTALGYLEAQHGDFDLAIGHLERAIAIPDRLEPESALLNLAVALMSRPGSTHADRVRGIGYMEQAAAIVDPEPRTAESAAAFIHQGLLPPYSTQMALGLANSREKNYAQAAKAFRRATLLDDNSGNKASAFSSLGVALNDNNQETEAIAAFKSATAIYERPSFNSAKNPQVYAMLGKLEIKHGDTASGQDDLEKASALNKNDAVVQSNLADLYVRQRKYAEAAAAHGAAAGKLEADIKASPEGATPDQRKLLGNLRYHQGLELASANHTADMSQQAIDAYKKAIAADPDNAEAMINCGALLYGSGKYDDAITYYNMALARNPKPSLALLAWKNLAIAYNKEHDAEKTDMAWREVEKFEPKNPNALGSRASSIVAANPIDDAAIPIYKKLATLKPDDAEPLINLGLLYERQVPYVSTAAAKQARLLAAMQCFTEAVKRGTAAAANAAYDPTAREVANALTATAYNNRGVIHEQSGEIALAKADYQKALDVKPDFGDARKNLIRFTQKPAPVVKPNGRRS